MSVGGVVAAAGCTAYLLSDRHNLSRADFSSVEDVSSDFLEPDEKNILLLASLAPSGHNTQPWFVTHLEPYHWTIGNDRHRWLPAVDPTQRETLLSLGAFLQNLEFAARATGYACQWTLLAATNQDERVMDVRLTKVGPRHRLNVEAMKSRRTLRGHFSPEPLRHEDVERLVSGEPDCIHYYSTASQETRFINEQTIEANRVQAHRDPAQEELAHWIRFSSTEAGTFRDGLTTGSMEITGLSGWAVRNLYDQASVLKTAFRERTIQQVREQVASSAGWISITSPDATVASLLEAGRRLQRLFLKVRSCGIGLHPMTQILEEPATKQALASVIEQGERIQFLLRVGYVKNYPPPVSLRRPVAWFLRKGEARA
ncbi:MAG: nitroreductase [Opitutus sp.]